MESHLLDGSRFQEAIVACFNTTKANAFDSNLLEPLLKVLRLSPSLAATLAKAEMYSGIAQKLNHKKPVVRLNLLRLVRNIMDNSDDSMVGGSSEHLSVLFEAIQMLAEKDTAVLVRNLASELVRSRIEVDHDGASISGVSSTASSSRSRSGPHRRNTLYTPPGLQPAISAPLTPTHGGARHHHGHYNQHRGLPRRSQSSLSASDAAFIEVAATPKRSALTLAHERESLLYRPGSRDGGSAGSSIPRRVSGDSSGSSKSSLSSGSSLSASVGSAGGQVAGANRLPRQPANHISRASLGPAIISRSDSSLSNKDNAKGRIPATGVLGPTLASESERIERLTALGSGMGGGSNSRNGRGMGSSDSAHGRSGSSGGRSSSKVSNRRRTRQPSTDAKWS